MAIRGRTDRDLKEAPTVRRAQVKALTDSATVINRTRGREMKIDLLKCLRIGDVPRWSIVPMTRQQSVAEHSYNVWLITRVLYDILYPTPHNSMERALTLEYALVHDLAEVVTGDIPSPAKRVIEDEAPGLLNKLEEKSLQFIYPDAVKLIRGAQNTPGQAIVKLADCVEALVFVSKFGTDKEAAMGVKKAMWKHLNEADKRYPNVEWVKAIDYLYEVFPELMGPDPMD